MSKQNNLKDYLTDLYAGISFKKPGASRNPQNFRSEIESIVTGGGASLAEFDGYCEVTGIPTEEDHVETLYEYDGKCKVSGVPSEDIPEGDGVDSPLPPESSTEEEMTALLETAEVGSVYKYTGTAGTYESGALYIVEAVSE